MIPTVELLFIDIPLRTPLKMDDFYLFQGLCTGGGVDPGNLAFSVPVNSGLDLSRSLSYNSLDNTVWRYDLEMLIIRKYFSRDLRV